MIYSADLNFAFVHISRTGGTSLRQQIYRGVLGHSAPPRTTVLMDRVPRRHIPASELRHQINGEWFHDAAKWDDLWSFTFVRNPWDRWHSLWAHYNLIKGIDEPFGHWLRNRIQTGVPQSFFYLCNCTMPDGTPKDQYVVVDDIFDYENREHHITNRIEPFLSVILPRDIHHLQTYRPDYREAYTDELAELVADFDSDVIERMNYTFD